MNGTDLLKILNKRGMTQRELARLTGYTPSAICKFISKDKPGTPKMISSIQEALGVNAKFSRTDLIRLHTQFMAYCAIQFNNGEESVLTFESWLTCQGY